MDREALRMQALRVTYAIWLREVKLFTRERGRIIGMIGQPLMYLLIVGQGIASGMTLDRSPVGMGYMLFLYPGILGMSVLFTSIFSAISIIWDREFGFLKEVLVAPAPRWAVAAGKVLGGATVATLQSAILLLLAPLAGVRPTPLVVLQLLLLCFLMSCAMTSMGVAIAARMRSMQGFQMVMNFLVMPLYFLSGAMFPVTSAPPWMKTLMTVDPLTYGVDALRTVVLSAAPGEAGALQEAARAAGLIRFDLLTNVSVLVGVAVVLAAVAAFSFNRTD
jgi:ABC-2 type transport system permease protein